MIKKVNVFLVCLLLCAGQIQVKAADEMNLSYRIFFDSHEQHETEVIQEMLRVYHQLTKSVKRKSRGAIVRQHLSEFKQHDNDEVKLENNVLILVLGDGKGTLIEGDFQFLDCGVEIETTSWLFEKLGW